MLGGFGFSFLQETHLSQLDEMNREWISQWFRGDNSTSVDHVEPQPLKSLKLFLPLSLI